MTSVEMHIQFRTLFNKVNSNKNKAFLPQEIDLFLNDQMDEFVDVRTSPKSNYKNEGFEETQKRLDDIRTVIKEGSTVSTSGKALLVATLFPKGFAITLPNDYLKLVDDSSDTYTDTTNYFGVPNRLTSSAIIRNAMLDSFHTTNVRSPLSEIVGTILRVYENNFKVSNVYITYVYKYPKIAYNTQDCVLPIGTHREIVDMAVSKVNAIVNSGNYEKYLNETSKNE